MVAGRPDRPCRHRRCLRAAFPGRCSCRPVRPPRGLAPACGACGEVRGDACVCRNPAALLGDAAETMPKPAARTRAKPSARTSARSAPAAPGVLPDAELHRIVKHGGVMAEGGVSTDQIQPASLDLRLGKVAYRLRASFLPGKQVVADRLDDSLVMHT